MDLQSKKLPLYIIANTTAIMGITHGKRKSEVVGADLYLYDKIGNRQYQGIIEPFVFYIDFLTMLGYNIPNIVRKGENYAKTRTYERGSG